MILNYWDYFWQEYRIFQWKNHDEKRLSVPLDYVEIPKELIINHHKATLYICMIKIYSLKFSS
jgi:hypothetical protein